MPILQQRQNPVTLPDMTWRNPLQLTGDFPIAHLHPLAGAQLVGQFRELRGSRNPEIVVRNGQKRKLGKTRYWTAKKKQTSH